MVRKMAVLAAAWILCGAAAPAPAAPAPDAPGEVFLQIKGTLDEPRGYCIDAPGRPEEVMWSDTFQVHTCKQLFDHRDQLFEAAAVAKGRLRLTRYDHCLEPKGDKVLGVVCSASAAQAWRVGGDGRISPAADTTRCLTVGDTSTPAGTAPGVTPTWKLRPITLEACAPALADRQQWGTPRPKQPG